MVKTPRTRHTRRNRPPVTIELAANEVSSVEERATQPGDSDVAAAGQPLERPRDEIHTSEVTEQVQIEEPVEERLEAERAATGDDRRPSGYAFEANEREVPPPTHERAGFLGGAGAGLVGALAMLAGLLGLQWAGVLPSPGGSSGASQAEIVSLRNDVAALRAAPSPDSGLSASIEQLKADLASLQSSTQAANDADGAMLAALDAKVKELESRVANPSADLTGKIAGVESQVAAGDGRIAALEQSLAGLTSKVDQQASQPRVAMAIAAAALKSAVARGGPFSAELETLGAIAPDAPELGALRSFAEDGVPTEADIAAGFGPAADAMVAAGTPADENAGLLQRLYDSARSMVKVRPVGEVAGDDAGARVARMEVALKAGDYDKAIAEYDGLPEPAKAAGTAYFDRLKARLEAMKLIDQLVAGAMKAA